MPRLAGVRMSITLWLRRVSCPTRTSFSPVWKIRKGNGYRNDNGESPFSLLPSVDVEHSLNKERDIISAK